MFQRTLTFILVVAFILLPGCAKAPSEVISASDQAFATLDASEAGLYAAADLEAAQAALAAARTELSAQQEKFALSRSYDETERLFAEASSLAEKATQAASDGRRQAQEAADESVSLVKALIEDSTVLLQDLQDCPRKAKGLTADTAMLQGRLAGFSDVVPSLESKIAEADYLGAHTQADGLFLQIDEMNQELGAALGRLGCQRTTT